MRFLAVAAADSSALVAELDAVAAQDAAAMQAALAHAALLLRLSSTTTMSASTQPSMARLLRARRPRRTPLPRRPYSPTLIAPSTLGHAAVWLRPSSTTTMSASTRPSMARLLRSRHLRRPQLPPPLMPGPAATPAPPLPAPCVGISTATTSRSGLYMAVRRWRCSWERKKWQHLLGEDTCTVWSSFYKWFLDDVAIIEIVHSF